MTWVKKLISIILIIALVALTNGCGAIKNLPQKDDSQSSKNSNQDSYSFIAIIDQETGSASYTDNNNEKITEQELQQKIYKAMAYKHPVSFSIATQGEAATKTDNPYMIRLWGYFLRIQIEQDDLHDCIEVKKCWHLNIHLGKEGYPPLQEITNIHLCAWWEDGYLQFGIYDSGLHYLCKTTRGGFTWLVNKLKEIIQCAVPFMPAVIVGAMAYTTAVVIFPMLIAVAAANDTNSDPSTVALPNIPATPILGDNPIMNPGLPEITTLESYYQKFGKSVPATDTLALFYEAFNLEPDAKYSNTPDQNALILYMLKCNTTSPTNIDELISYLGEPSLPSGVDNPNRSSKNAWCFTDYKGELVGIHTGKDDRKIYLIRRKTTGEWYMWKVLPDCGTTDAPTIATLGNDILVSFRGGDGKIWVGMLQNGENWSGWRDTGRKSKFGPVLATDGKTAFLIHDGAGDDRIYYSSNALWFNSGWIDTGRDSKTRCGASVWNKHLFIAHKGANDCEIYYKDVTDGSSNEWRAIGRQTYDSPSIFVFNGEVYIAHQGANNTKGYVGKVGDADWTEIKEPIHMAPYISKVANSIGCAYIDRWSMRLQWIKDIPKSPNITSNKVEDTNRTTLTPWGFFNYKGELLGIHAGESDGKIYLVRRKTTGEWYMWKVLPDCSTKDTPSVAVVGNDILVTFRGGDGKNWIGMLQNGEVWSGWRSTGRSSKYGPILASDGIKATLIHDGSGNDRIYYSTNSPWFASGWVDTGRDSKTRCGATMYNGQTYIIHKGANDNEIYYSTNPSNPSSWVKASRQTLEAPTICVDSSGKIYIGHEGANDMKNYIGTPATNTWKSIEEITITQPHIGFINGKLAYGYVNGASMRLQWVEP